MSRNAYLVNVSVCGRLFWSVICGTMSYGILISPIRRWEDVVFVAIFGVGLAVLCVLAAIAAARLFWLKCTLIFWH